MKATALLLLPILVLTRPAVGAAPLGSNLILNGDFEILGDHDFPPWQFQNGFAAYVNEYWPRVANGRNCIFVGGLMWQDLLTEAGQRYRLSYYERGDDTGQTARYSVLNVFWGDELVASHIEFNGDPAWNHREFTVVATGSTTRITFQQASAAIGSYGLPAVDLIEVVTIPEPSSLGLAVLVLSLWCSHRVALGKRRRLVTPKVSVFCSPTKAAAGRAGMQ